MYTTHGSSQQFGTYRHGPFSEEPFEPTTTLKVGTEDSTIVPLVPTNLSTNCWSCSMMKLQRFPYRSDLLVRENWRDVNAKKQEQFKVASSHSGTNTQHRPSPQQNYWNRPADWMVRHQLSKHYTYYHEL